MCVNGIEGKSILDPGWWHTLLKMYILRPIASQCFFFLFSTDTTFNKSQQAEKLEISFLFDPTLIKQNMISGPSKTNFQIYHIRAGLGLRFREVAKAITICWQCFSLFEYYFSLWGVIFMKFLLTMNASLTQALSLTEPKACLCQNRPKTKKNKNKKWLRDSLCDSSWRYIRHFPQFVGTRKNIIKYGQAIQRPNILFFGQKSLK